MKSIELPSISIWIAARNEQQNIINCLQSVAAQEYPPAKIQVLVGNDGSTDDTANLVTSFIEDKPSFKLINISKTINNQKGKANVLANLYEYSTGEYFLILDADVIVGKLWCKGMIINFLEKSNLGHQVGITSIKSTTLFGVLQSIDWLWALTLLKLAAFFNIPLTGLGNNSAVSRKAYEKVGGYAKIPFSITEDFALFHEIIKAGFSFENSINKNIYAKTTSMATIQEFLHQRKRWMVGALQCPWWVVLFLYLQALFPFILLFFSLKFAFFLLIAKIVVQFLLLLPTLIILNEVKLSYYLIIYEFYSWLWGFTMVVFYFLPINVDWKGRIYKT